MGGAHQNQPPETWHFFYYFFIQHLGKNSQVEHKYLQLVKVIEVKFLFFSFSCKNKSQDGNVIYKNVYNTKHLSMFLKQIYSPLIEYFDDTKGWQSTHIKKLLYVVNLIKDSIKKLFNHPRHPQSSLFDCKKLPKFD